MSRLRLRLHLSMPGLLEVVRKDFGTVSEPIKPRKYSLADLLSCGLGIFAFKFPSQLQFDNAMRGQEEDARAQNLQSHLKVDEVPCDTQDKNLDRSGKKHYGVWYASKAKDGRSGNRDERIARMTTEHELRNMLTAKAEADEQFRELLLSNPKAAVLEVTGIVIPDNINVHVHEQSSSDLHMVLPASDRLSIQDIEAVSGGSSYSIGSVDFHAPLA